MDVRRLSCDTDPMFDEEVDWRKSTMSTFTDYSFIPEDKEMSFNLKNTNNNNSNHNGNRINKNTNSLYEPVNAIFDEVKYRYHDRKASSYRRYWSFTYDEWQVLTMLESDLINDQSLIFKIFKIVENSSIDLHTILNKNEKLPSLTFRALQLLSDLFDELSHELSETVHNDVIADKKQISLHINEIYQQVEAMSSILVPGIIELEELLTTDIQILRFRCKITTFDNFLPIELWSNKNISLELQKAVICAQNIQKQLNEQRTNTLSLGNIDTNFSNWFLYIVYLPILALFVLVFSVLQKYSSHRANTV